MQKITREWLKENLACAKGVRYWNKKKISDPEKLAKQLIKDEKLFWANWMVVRCLDHNNQIRYAIFAAKKYPDDKRLRKAIEATKQYLKSHNVEDKNAAVYAIYAADAVYAAADAAFAVDAADEMKVKIILYGLGLFKKGESR